VKTGQPHVEALGEHTYLIRVLEGEDTIEIRVHASPAVLAGLPEGTDENRLVEVTAAYLIGRQRADDLPPTLDLDDVAAAYDGYLDEIAAQLAAAEAER
jgi:hypothetical protein